MIIIISTSDYKDLEEKHTRRHNFVRGLFNNVSNLNYTVSNDRMI
jgi:hypothetical protein